MKYINILMDILILFVSAFSPKKTKETKLDINYDNIKDAALTALEDSGAKDDLLDLLISHKELFVDECKGYLKAIVATFRDESEESAKYEEFLRALDSQRMVEEVAATADQIEGLVRKHEAKKKLLDDMKDVASAAVKKAVVAGLIAAVGPAAGPIAMLLNG